MAKIEESDVVRGVYQVTLEPFGDERGRFVETFRQSWIPGAAPMVQQNRSEKKAGTVVGLHYHLRQADYWYVTRGHARVVLHDLRTASPTEGGTEVIEAGAGGAAETGIYVPPGVAHGFAALSDLTLTYLVDRYYDASDELGVAHDDPALAIEWGLAEPVLSERDRSLPLRADIHPEWLPRYQPAE